METEPAVETKAIEEALEKERDKFNVYASHKSVSQEFLNVGIITFYINILYTTLKGELSGEEVTVVILSCMAIVLQITIGFLVFLLLKTNRSDKKRKGCSTVGINNTVTLLSGISTVVNIAITTVYGSEILNP